MEAIKNYLTQLDKKHLVFTLSILLLVSPLLYISSLHNPSHVPRLALLSLMAVIGMVFYLFYLWKLQSNFYFHKVHLLVLVFLAWATISISWTVDYGNFAYEIIPLWALVGLFFIASHVANFQNVKLFIFISIIGALYASIIALLQNYGLNPSFIHPEVLGMHSTFGFKNHFALYLDLIVPVSLSLLLSTKNFKFRWVLTLFSGVIIGVLIETHTRGSWLTLLSWLAIAIGIIFISHKSYKETSLLILKRKYELLLIILITCLITIPQGHIDKTWGRNVPEGKIIDNSSKYRLQMYYNSLNMIKDHPVTGVGYGAFWKGFRDYMNHPEIIKRTNAGNYIYRLHSDPLQYFTELGIPGGLLILLIFFYVLYMGIRLFFQYDDPYKKIIILGLTMSILACGGHSLIDFPLHKPSSAIQFWVFLGLIAGLYVKNVSNPVKVNKFYIVLTTVLTLLYTATAMAFHLKNIKGNYYHRQAELTKDCAEATRFMDLSIKEGGFYVLSHAYRVSVHIKCKTPNPILFKIIQEELTWDPTNIKALYFRGQIMLESGYPERALNDFNRIIYLLPHHSPAKIAAVSALLKLDKKNEAIDLTNKIIEQHPELDNAKKLLEEISQ